MALNQRPPLCSVWRLLFFCLFVVFVAMVCDYALIGLNLLPSSVGGLSARAGFVGGGRPEGPPFWAKAEDSPPRFRP